jgi:hypothetical protein
MSREPWLAPQQRDYALRAGRRSIAYLDIIINQLARDQVEQALETLEGVERDAELIRRICEEAKARARGEQ